MRVESTSFNPTTSTQSKNIDSNNTAYNKPLLEFKNQASGSEISSTGKDVSVGNSATVKLNDEVESSILPNYVQQKVSIQLKNGDKFDIPIHISSNIDAETNQKALKNLTKTLSNIPKNVLKDLNVECKNIILSPNILFNKAATAQAFPALNQMLVSANNLAQMSEGESATTIVHELGHLVDDSKEIGKATKFYGKEFDTLKKLATSELGFKEDSHMYDKCSEFFADYYAFNAGVLVDTPTRKAKTQFDLFENYLKDFENLSEKDFNAKYKDKGNDIKQVASAWKDLKHNFDYYLRNVNDGSLSNEDRADSRREPMSPEQIAEKINVNTAKEPP